MISVKIKFLYIQLLDSDPRQFCQETLFRKNGDFHIWGISLIATMETKRINPMQAFKMHVDDSRDKGKVRTNQSINYKGLRYYIQNVIESLLFSLIPQFNKTSLVN